MKLSLLSLSFCSILSSRRLPLTPLSFVPPGSWCVLSGGRGGVGGWGDEEGEEVGGGGQGALPFLQGAFDAHLAAPCHVAILPF